MLVVLPWTHATCTTCLERVLDWLLPALAHVNCSFSARKACMAASNVLCSYIKKNILFVVFRVGVIVC